MKLIDFVLNKAFVREDILTQDKYLAYAENNEDWIQYVKTDSLFHSFHWRNNRFIEKYTPQKAVVISGHSDHAVKQEYLSQILRPPVKLWFGINADCENPNVFSLPHGLTNDCNDTVIHPILGNQDILCEVLSSEKVPKHLVYMNFNVTTDKRTSNPIRQQLWNRFSYLDFVYKKQCTDANLNLLDRKQYLQDLFDSKFVLCPQGNGIDTVRLWEALYCRAIPIVQRHRAMKQFEDLPILWINDWVEVMNSTYLESQYEQIINSDWNLEKLKISYWMNLISQLYKERVLSSSNETS
jgi:hypothetical protein